MDPGVLFGSKDFIEKRVMDTIKVGLGGMKGGAAGVGLGGMGGGAAGVGWVGWRGRGGAGRGGEAAGARVPGGARDSKRDASGVAAWRWVRAMRVRASVATALPWLAETCSGDAQPAPPGLGSPLIPPIPALPLPCRLPATPTCAT